MIFLAWRSAGITLKTPPIERYDFSASKLYPIFFQLQKKNRWKNIAKKWRKKWKFPDFPRFFLKMKILNENCVEKKITKKLLFFEKYFLVFFHRKKIYFFGVEIFFWIQFRTRKSISFDWWGFQSDSGTEERDIRKSIFLFKWSKKIDKRVMKQASPLKGKVIPRPCALQRGVNL